MSKKSRPQATETKHDRDMASFERLPEKTKDLMTAKEHHDKTTGHEKSAATKHIEETAASHDRK